MLKKRVRRPVSAVLIWAKCIVLLPSFLILHLTDRCVSVNAVSSSLAYTPLESRYVFFRVMEWAVVRVSHTDTYTDALPFLLLLLLLLQFIQQQWQSHLAKKAADEMTAEFRRKASGDDGDGDDDDEKYVVCERERGLCEREG